MRIIICDDDNLIVAQIQRYLKFYFNQNNQKCPETVCYSDGESLLADKGEKEILFLDIEMPGINGIYVGNKIKQENKNAIIFVVTSFSEYLDEAMRFHVFRYLSKPLDKQRFLRNIEDALALYSTRSIQLPVETREEIHTISTSSIISIEAVQKAVIVHTTMRDFESIYPMQYWYNLLPKNCFFRTHRSYIVNLEHVCDFSHTIIHMTEKKYPAYLSRRKYSAFKQAYLFYLESTR